MRTHFVKKARKAQGKCLQCGKKIEVGASYRWAKGRYGPKMVKCSDHSFKASELTNSDKLSRVYAAQESATDRISAWDGDDLESLRGILEETANEINKVADEYQESADNIREHFSESSTAARSRLLLDPDRVALEGSRNRDHRALLGLDLGTPQPVGP